jgi:hypothetical protein
MKVQSPERIRTVNEVLDEAEHAVRTNWKNDGRGFQAELVMTCEAYLKRGTAKIVKVDPPTRVVGGGAARKVIFMHNPFLDFVGCWEAHHGRAIMIEAKAHDSGRLGIDAGGGLTSTQWSSLRSWRKAGAVCCVLWRRKAEVRLFLPEKIQDELDSGGRSLTFESGLPVAQGAGEVIWDFLSVLEKAIWGGEKI